MRRLLISALFACGTPSSPATTPPAPSPSPPSSAPNPRADPTSVGCFVMPQPSKPGHATVEPDDMICAHGDTPYRCPDGFDGKPFRCEHATKYPTWAGTSGVPWCCHGE